MMFKRKFEEPVGIPVTFSPRPPILEVIVITHDEKMTFNKVSTCEVNDGFLHLVVNPEDARTYIININVDDIKTYEVRMEESK